MSLFSHMKIYSSVKTLFTHDQVLSMFAFGLLGLASVNSLGAREAVWYCNQNRSVCVTPENYRAKKYKYQVTRCEYSYKECYVPAPPRKVTKVANVTKPKPQPKPLSTKSFTRIDAGSAPSTQTTISNTTNATVNQVIQFHGGRAAAGGAKPPAQPSPQQTGQEAAPAGQTTGTTRVPAAAPAAAPPAPAPATLAPATSYEDKVCPPMRQEDSAVNNYDPNVAAKECRNRERAYCEKQREEAAKAIKDFNKACQTLKTGEKERRNCFDEAFKCKSIEGLSQTDNSNIFIKAAAQSLLGISSPSSTKKTWDQSVPENLCKVYSGKKYETVRDGLERKIDRLKESEKDLSKELQEKQAKRAKKKVEREKALKTAKSNYVKSTTEAKSKLDSNVASMEKQTRNRFADRQKLESQLSQARMSANAASLAMASYAKTFSKELYSRSCMAKAQKEISKDASIKVNTSFSERKQLALDQWAQCLSEIEMKYQATLAEAQSKFDASKQSITQLEESLAQHQKDIQDDQTEISRLKQQAIEDAENRKQEYYDALAGFAQDDKAESDETIQDTLRLQQNLMQTTGDLNEQMNRLKLAGAQALSEDPDQDKGLSALREDLSTNGDIIIELRSTLKCDEVSVAADLRCIDNRGFICNQTKGSSDAISKYKKANAAQ